MPNRLSSQNIKVVTIQIENESPPWVVVKSYGTQVRCWLCISLSVLKMVLGLYFVVPVVRAERFCTKVDSSGTISFVLKVGGFRHKMFKQRLMCKTSG